MYNYLELTQNFSNVETKINYPMAKHTTFKVGGPCDVGMFPKKIETVKKIINFVKGRYPYCVIGRGSNLLVSDKGFKGVCIFTENLNKITLKGNILEAECGTKISDILKVSSQNNLSGLEFAVGIPGSIGGLVAMNGGCFNKTVSEIVCYVKAEDCVYNQKRCDFNYRSSRFLEGEVILSVGLKLKVSEEDIIQQKIERFQKARTKSQPKGKTSGSVFLNQGYFAGKVIDQAGLKGYKVGGAKISEKHANFIINENGTATDIYKLINIIKETVLLKLGIALCEEVRYIGEF